MEPEGLVRLFMLSASLGLGIYVIERVVLPLVGRLVQYLRDPAIELMEGFYYYTHNRLDSIFLGVLIAYLYVQHREAFERVCRRVGRRARRDRWRGTSPTA